MNDLLEDRTNDSQSPAKLEAAIRTAKAMGIMAGLPGGVSVSEVAAKVGATKGMVSRILASLEYEGYAQQDPHTRRYSLTFKFLALARRHADCMKFPDLCRPILRRLVQDTGEQAQLVLVGPEGAVLYAKEDSLHEVQVVSQARLHPWYLHCSATEKVYLASLPEGEALSLVAKTGLPRLTPRTITSVERFAEEMRKVRAQGFATNEGERTLEVNTVAVPVRDQGGEVVAAVALTGPASRFAAEKLPSFVPRLSEAAAELSEIWSFPGLEAPEAGMLLESFDSMEERSGRSAGILSGGC